MPTANNSSPSPPASPLLASSSPSPSEPTESTSLLPASAAAQSTIPVHPKRKLGNGKRYDGAGTYDDATEGHERTRLTPTVESLAAVDKGIVVKQQKVLTSIPLLILFFILLLLTFLSTVLTLLLLLNTAHDLSSAFSAIPFRGSGFLEIWVAGLGTWAGLGAILFFSQPVYLLFLVNGLTLLLHVPLVLLTTLSPPLRRAHYPLLALPLGITALTYLFALLSSFAVRRAKSQARQRVIERLAHAQAAAAHARSLRESELAAAASSHGHAHAHASAETQRKTHEREEARRQRELARTLVGMESVGGWGRSLWMGVKAVVAFVGGLLGLVVIVLLFANLCLTAYDNTLPLPRPESKLITVKPKHAAWSYQVHLLCTDPPALTNTTDPTDPNESYSNSGPSFPSISNDLESVFQATNAPSDHRVPHPRQNVTIIYEAPSGVPGSIAHLKPVRPPLPSNPFPVPRPPNNQTTADGTNAFPGSWIVSLQGSHKVGRVCVWDRPGYGFSDVAPSADLGLVADSLQQALEKAGETGPYVLVGDGYGGLVSRIFAARHAKLVHSILHIDPQTANAYFLFPPRDNALTLTFKRFFGSLLPAVMSPLGINRFYDLFLYYSSATSRVLASSRPKPASTQLSEKMQKTLLQELYLSHTHDSLSYRQIFQSLRKYPADKPAIILSSDKMMKESNAWAEGQRSLAEEVTSEKGRLRWEVVKKGIGHDLCSPLEGDARGRRECTRALIELVALPIGGNGTVGTEVAGREL